MRPIVAALAAALATAALAAPPPDAAPAKAWTPAAKAELKRLDGKWEVFRSVGTGKEEEAANSGVFFTFKGADITLSSGNTNKQEQLRVGAIDPTTDPKCIDLIETRRDKTERVLEGVYRIDGDTLKLAFHVPEGGAKSRPTGFAKPTDPQTLVWTLRRVKE